MPALQAHEHHRYLGVPMGFEYPELDLERAVDGLVRDINLV